MSCEHESAIYGKTNDHTRKLCINMFVMTMLHVLVVCHGMSLVNNDVAIQNELR